MVVTADAADELLEPFLKIDWSVGKEPGDAYPAEEPTRLKRMVMRALAEDVMYRCLAGGLNFKVTMGNILTLTPALTITQT